MLTAKIAASSFEIVAVQSITFTGPSTDTLMALVGTRDLPLTFGLGMILGVCLGALIAAIWAGEARIQRFEPGIPMERYLIGGALMGFGSMLAGGCAVGAGVSGGSILSLTAWTAVAFMWVGALMTQLLIDTKPWNSDQRQLGYCAAKGRRASSHCVHRDCNAHINRSTSTSECTGEGVMRRRSVPLGTVG